MATVEWEGFARFDAGLAALAEFDAYPLMEQWCGVMVEGNRKGVLSGVDGFGNPMPPLKYRDGAGRKTARRRAPDFGTNRHAPGNAALEAAQYRDLTGPRLAPRGDASHIIKNLHQEIRHFPEEHRWEAVCAWSEFLDAKGNDVFRYHFDGLGHNPRYDLRPVRPDDLRFCANALRAFVKGEFFARL